MRSQQIFPPAIATVIGLALLLYAIVPRGIGISEDSVSYFAAANSIHVSGGMLDIDGNYFVAWAPLYPFMVAYLRVSASGMETAAAAVNALLFVLMAVSTWPLIKNSVEKPFYRAACMFSILFSFTIMQVYTVALTEAMFLWLANLVLLQLAPKEEGRSNWIYGRLVLLCATILSLRYAGIFALPVVLFFFSKEKKLTYRELLLFLGICCTPILIWLVRNWTLTGTLAGFRASSGTFFLKNMTVLAETVTSWILPIKIPLFIRLAVLASLIVLLRKGLFRKENRFHLLFIASYFFMLVLAYAFFSFEEPRDRLLAPIFISFFILLFSALEHLAGRLPGVPYPFFAGVICLWIFYPASRIIKHVQLWHHQGVEVYNKKYWHESPAMAWLKKNSLPGSIFSNDAAAIYYFTRNHAFRVPKSFYRFDELHKSVDDGDYLVWWKNKEYYDLEAVKQDFVLEKEMEFEDAEVYRMRLRWMSL